MLHIKLTGKEAVALFQLLFCLLYTSLSTCNQGFVYQRDTFGAQQMLVFFAHLFAGMRIEKLVISLYAKGMSVSDIEDELRDIYGITSRCRPLL